MKRVSASLVAIVALLATALLAQSTQSKGLSSSCDARSHAAIEGVWGAQIHGLPAVTLNLSYETDSLHGAILIYLSRKNPGVAETSMPGVPEPLMDPHFDAHFDGVALVFAVSHRHAHSPESLGTSPVHFRMRITAADGAEFSGEDSPTVSLTRDKD